MLENGVKWLLLFAIRVKMNCSKTCRKVQVECATETKFITGRALFPTTVCYPV